MISLSSFALLATQALLGQWQFFKMVYQGRELPPRDSNLVLRYTFSEDGQSHLKWFYKNDDRFQCERRGEFRVEGSFFFDRVAWVNPSNSVSCSQDPDMQLGRESQVPFYFTNEGYLVTRIPLNGEFIEYVWMAVPTETDR